MIWYNISGGLGDSSKVLKIQKRVLRIMNGIKKSRASLFLKRVASLRSRHCTF
jgi:transposase-like protein